MLLLHSKIKLLYYFTACCYAKNREKNKPSSNEKCIRLNKIIVATACQQNFKIEKIRFVETFLFLVEEIYMFMPKKTLFDISKKVQNKINPTLNIIPNL